MTLTNRRVFSGSLFLTLLIGAIFLISRQIPTAYAQPTADDTIFLPMTAKPVQSCNTPVRSYGTLHPNERTDRPAAQHPDINLTMRGWSPSTARMSLVLYGGDTDPLAPQIAAMFSPRRLPRFTSAYQVHHWDWSCNCRRGPNTQWDVTLLGMGTTPGEPLSIPDSGYDIGGGYETLVLYATENRLTLKYSAEDNVVQGYTVHLEDICVDPDLLRQYRSLNAAGRSQLPALRAGQPFGRAIGNEIRIAIRDNGTFLDPRSQKDWWKAYPVP